MGDYLRLLTVNDRDIPLATLQRSVPTSRSGQSIIPAFWATIWPSGPNKAYSRTSGPPSSATLSAPIHWVPKKSPSSSIAWMRAALHPRCDGWAIT